MAIKLKALAVPHEEGGLRAVLASVEAYGRVVAVGVVGPEREAGER